MPETEVYKNSPKLHKVTIENKLNFILNSLLLSNKRSFKDKHKDNFEYFKVSNNPSDLIEFQSDSFFYPKSFDVSLFFIFFFL